MTPTAASSGAMCAGYSVLETAFSPGMASRGHSRIVSVFG
jgi:hypothetical protein